MDSKAFSAKIYRIKSNMHEHLKSVVGNKAECVTGIRHKLKRAADGAQNFTRDFLKIWTCKEAVSKLYGTGQPYLYDTAQNNAHFLNFSYSGGVLALSFEGLVYVRRDISPKDFWLTKR